MPPRTAASIANALSPGIRKSARHSLQRFAYKPDNSDDNDSNPNISESDLSTPPSSDAESSSNNGRPSKRKRGTPSSKTSSRKVPKLEPKPSPVIKQENGKPKRPPSTKKKPKLEDALPVEPPANWREMWDITSEMRKRILAPVDTMGCESLAEDHRSPRDRRLQTLVALMLSSQTKDTVTAVAMKNLQMGLEGGFTLESLLEVEPEVLNRMIGSVGFHNNKTKYIKATAVILRDGFGGDIPDTIEGLVSLPGVGPKMAYLTMSAAWGRDEGIGVDVHVHRITNLWKWHKTNNPEQTRAALEAWLPRERWHAINHLLVGFGQTVCLPVGRRCGECEVGRRGLCPSRVEGSPRKRKVVKKETEVEVEGELVVKTEEVVVEKDDVGEIVRVKSEDVGDVVLQRIPDLEDF